MARRSITVYPARGPCVVPPRAPPRRASMLDYGGARTAHGGPGPCGARSLPVANVRVVVAAVRVPRCRGRAPSNRGAVCARVRRPPAPTFFQES